MDKQEGKKSNHALAEEEVLQFWNDNNIFQKSLEKDSPKGEFVFYDGPPFATGMPHYGHLVPGTMKDIIPRYKTMQGYHVARRWGWDCHGLPIENLIEKELGLETKKDIEEYGIEKFNTAARDSVLRYEQQWKEYIPRVGRWVDMEDPYMSMRPSYMESVWWVFGELYKKDLITQGFKAMHLCPRCETTLANFEVNQGYKDIKDLSVTAQFKLIDEPGVYFLAWTTTPWTLPGNAALAIGETIDYVKVKTDDGQFIIAKDLVEQVMEGKEYEMVDERKGADLVGKKYVPVFDYYASQNDLENRENGWQVYAADFVTTENGTGIVHIAPAFGSDDMDLGKRESLPFIQHVHKNGTFKDDVTDFAGQPVKSRDDHMATDIDIVKYLAYNGKLFSKKKYEHSYPHCWRCDTPLLNYATTSWFVDVPSIKDRLLANNQKTSWTPDHIRNGRFGKWLDGARDWALSRSRFWGTPLPVWINPETEEVTIIDSVESLKKHTKKSGNTYFAMRHGEAESNVKKLLTTNINTPDNLTEAGKGQAAASAENLRDKHIDLIFHSPFTRTTETANIVAEVLGLSADQIIIEDRIHEVNVGVLDGMSYLKWHTHSDEPHEYHKAPEGGESLHDVKVRMGDFLYELEEKYQGKNILIISHGSPLWMLKSAAYGLDESGTIESEVPSFKNAEIRQVDFVPLPHNEHYELDLHRPYIDDIAIVDDAGNSLQRVEDVFDVWFDSGCMPYAQAHYPFENKDSFEGGRFPADFIAEGQDQTRGWFYVMSVLGTALFDQVPFKNVIVNGLVLAEDGKKMSKRLQNYPEMDYMINKTGADALRLFLMSSPVVRSEDVLFSEKGVREVLSKVMGRLRNVVSFYEMYADDAVEYQESSNILDQWIIARLYEIHADVTASLDTYEIDRAARPIFGFVDDLSTWYVRRSRDRFKGSDTADRDNAIVTTRFVLKELSKIMAPFTPFIAEEVYQKVKGKNGKESVHLEDWSAFDLHDQQVLDTMTKTREIISQLLEMRASIGIKVRQPLASATVPGDIDSTYTQLIIDEVNVKEIKKGTELALDTDITPSLQAEGDMRELIRHIQSMRKTARLTPDQHVTLSVQTDDAGQVMIEKFNNEIKKVAGISVFVFEENEGEEKKVNDMTFKLVIK